MKANILPTVPAVRPRKILVADLFCGAGGSSTGAKRALRDLGYEMDLVCVNHWSTAVDTHTRNHPEARHYCQDVSTVKPHLVVPEGKLDLLMASPTCTFHSRARGGKPISDQQRMDPWHIVAWLTELRVKRLIIENVPEFLRWGPVNPQTHRPVKSREGEYFVRWVETIKSLGFKVDFRVLNCANYGDATTRARFFLIARNDGQPLRWPEATHAKKGKVEGLFDHGLHPWRAAREVIDWSIKGQSIFTRKRPLSPKTLERIYAGAVKFGWPEPFLVVLRNHMDAQSTAKNNGPLVVEPMIAPYYGSGSGETCRDIEHPVPTVTTKSRFGLVMPITHTRDTSNRSRSVDEPLPTVTGANRGELAFIAAQFGERPGQSPRVHDVNAPVPTICAEGRVQLVEPGRDFDILFRMLEPHELAAAMGFDAEDQKYEFAGTKTDVIRQIGNAVPVATAAALVRALMETTSRR